MAAGAAEKLASQMGWIYVTAVLPLVSGGGFEASEMAHVQGYYSGITYGTGAPAPVAAEMSWRPIMRPRRRM